MLCNTIEVDMNAGDATEQIVTTLIVELYYCEQELQCRSSKWRSTTTAIRNVDDDD